MLLYNKKGESYALELIEEQVIQRLIFGWYAKQDVYQITSKTDVAMLVRLLRNVCRLSQWYQVYWGVQYHIPQLTEEQVVHIQQYLMPFLKNSAELVPPLEVV